jgi:hypothetical protein
MSFTISCNYRVLIVVRWVCQSKVPSSIIMNSVSVGYSQAKCSFTHQIYQNDLGLFGMRLRAGAIDATPKKTHIEI